MKVEIRIFYVLTGGIRPEIRSYNNNYKFAPDRIVRKEEGKAEIRRCTKNMKPQLDILRDCQIAGSLLDRKYMYAIRRRR